MSWEIGFRVARDPELWDGRRQYDNIQQAPVRVVKPWRVQNLPQGGMTATMTETPIDDKLTVSELTQPGQPSTDPDYIAWKNGKVQKALDAAKANPEEMLSHEDVRNQLDI